MVNTHSTYDGDDAQRRSRLDAATGAEFDRLASAHWQLIEQMIAEQPAAPAHNAPKTK